MRLNYQKNVVDKLLSLTAIVRTMSLAFFRFSHGNNHHHLMTVTHFKVALRKEEIELLRLMGASTGYVRKPFNLDQAVFPRVLSPSTVVYILFGGHPLFHLSCNAGISQWSPILVYRHRTVSTYRMAIVPRIMQEDCMSSLPVSGWGSPALPPILPHINILQSKEADSHTN